MDINLIIFFLKEFFHCVLCCPTSSDLGISRALPCVKQDKRFSPFFFPLGNEGQLCGCPVGFCWVELAEKYFLIVKFNQ